MVRLVKRFGWTSPADLRQAVAQNLVRQGKGITRHSIALGEIRAHADHLRALPREYRRGRLPVHQYVNPSAVLPTR